MSEYFNQLDPIAHERYREKLKLIGLSEEKDPYVLWNTEQLVRTCRWHDTSASHWIRPHFLLFYRASRTVHQARAYAVEEPRSVQLFPKWKRLWSEDIQGALYIDYDGLCEPSQKAPSYLDRCVFWWWDGYCSLHMYGWVSSVVYTSLWVKSENLIFFYIYQSRTGKVVPNSAAVMFKIECATRMVTHQ